MAEYLTVRNIEEIEKYLGRADVVAFDFETSATDEYRDDEWSALDAHKSDITGISMSVEPDTAIYVPLRHKTNNNANVENVMA